MLLSSQQLNESLDLVPMLSNVYSANSTGTARDRLILDLALKAVGNALGEQLTREGREVVEMIVAQVVHQGVIPGTYGGDKAYHDTLSGVLTSASSSGYSLSNTRELYALTNLAFNATANLHDAMYNPDGTIDYSVTRGLPLQLVSQLHGRVINRLTAGKSREDYATELQFGDSSASMNDQLNKYVREGVLDPSGTVYKRLREQQQAFNTLELYGLQQQLLADTGTLYDDWKLARIDANDNRVGVIERAEFQRMSEVEQRRILQQNLNYLRKQELIDEHNNLYYKNPTTGERVAMEVHIPGQEARAMRLSDLTLIGLADPSLQNAIDNGNTVLGAVIDQTSRNAAEQQLRDGFRSEYIFNKEIQKQIDESLTQAKHISFLSASTGITDLNQLEELTKAAGLGDLTDASSSGIQYTTSRLKELQQQALNTNRSIEELLQERMKLVQILSEDFGGEQFVSGAFVSTLQTIINNESFNRLNNEASTLRTGEELTSSILRSKQNAENLFGGFAIAEYVLNDIGDQFIDEDKRKEMQTLLETGRSALKSGDREQAYIVSQQLRAMADEVSGGQLSYYHIRQANKKYSDQDYLASVQSGLDLQVLDVLTRGVTEGNLNIYSSEKRQSADYTAINDEINSFKTATDEQTSISETSQFVQNGMASIGEAKSILQEVQSLQGDAKTRAMNSQRYKDADTYINNLANVLGVTPDNLFDITEEAFASKITKDNIERVQDQITSYDQAARTAHSRETSSIVRNILSRTGSDTTQIHELLSYISEYHNVYNQAVKDGQDPEKTITTWVQNTLTPRLRDKYYSDADIGNVQRLAQRMYDQGISPEKLGEFLTFAVTNTNTIVVGDNAKRQQWATYWQSIMNQSEQDTYNLSEFDQIVAGFYGDGSGQITESEALNLATTRYHRTRNKVATIESKKSFEGALIELFKATRNANNENYEGPLPDGITKGDSFAGYVFSGVAIDKGGNFIDGNNQKVNRAVAEAFWDAEIQEGGILNQLGFTNTNEEKTAFLDHIQARGAQALLTDYLGENFSLRVHKGTGTAYIIQNTLAQRLAAVENQRLQDMASVDLYKFTYEGSTIETSEFAEVAAQFFPQVFQDPANIETILKKTGYTNEDGNLTQKFIDELGLGSIIKQPDQYSINYFRTLLSQKVEDPATISALLPVIIDSAYGRGTYNYLTMDLEAQQDEGKKDEAKKRRELLLKDGNFRDGALQGLSIENVKQNLANGTLGQDTVTRILMSLSDVTVDDNDKNLTPVEEVLKDKGILAADNNGVYRITEGWATGLTITEAQKLLNEQAADGTGRTRAQVIQDTKDDINTSDGDFVNTIKKAVLGMEDDLKAIRNYVVNGKKGLPGPNNE